MKWWTWTLVFGAVAAGCSSEPKAQGDDDDDDDDDDDTTTESGTPTDSGFPSGPEPWEPVAVGFELDAILLADGTLGSYQIDGYGEILPTMYLTFTSLAYFDEGITADEQTEQSCLAWGGFTPAPLFPPDGIPLVDPAELFVSYDAALNIEYHTCTGKVVPETWGASAENLLYPFQGAHLGIGFGRQTDYLRDAWSEESIKTYGDAMLAEYVALNDSSGTFEGDDWTTAMMFEWDPVTETLVVDSEDLLVPMDVANLPSGSPLPEGYIRSFSYWYQDFPLLDLSNLTDGAP